MRKGTTSYRIKNESGLYYLTFSTVEWIDVFTRKNYKDIVVGSLQYCQQEKGLELYTAHSTPFYNKRVSMLEPHQKSTLITKIS